MRAWALVGILLVILGLTLGAQSQRETFFVDSKDESSGITGNVIPITAALVATGVVLLNLGWTKEPLATLRRPAAALWGGIWLLLVLGQSAYQNYLVLVEARYASLHISSLANDAESLPGAVLPIMVGWIGTSLLIYFGLKGFYPGPWRENADGVRRALLARGLLAVPVFGALIGSNVYLLATLDFQNSDLSPMLVLAPMVIASSLTLIVVQQIRCWNFGLALEDRRLGALMMQSWRNLNIVELVALIAFVVACAGGLVLPKVEFDNLNQGRSFVTNIRSFVVLQVLAILVYVPVIRSQRRAERILLRQEYEGHHSIHKGLLAASIMSGWALFALIGGPWVIDTGIWILIIATTPLAVYSMLSRGAQGALLGLLAGALWWSAGNAFSADHIPENFVLLRFVTPPGVQAVVRLVGVTFFGVAWFRIMQFLLPQPGRNAVAAFGLALAAWIEVSLAIWIIPHETRPFVGVGSFIQSQGAGFQAFFHIVAILGILGAAVVWSYGQRPEWFQKREEPLED